MARAWPLALLVLIMSIGVLTHWVALQELQVINGPDIKIHFRWALQFAAALSEGVLYPRWASYSYLGLGDPTFLYIHPLFYYVVAVFNALTGNIWAAILSVGAFTTAATAALTYWVARKHTGAVLALVASGSVAVSPYAFHLAHYQQFLPMHFAMPMLVLFLGILLTVSPRYRIPLTALSLALLILSHILVAFMALVCTGFVILWRAWRLKKDGGRRLLVQHGLSVLLGLALSAIYLVPAMTTQQLVSPGGWYVPIYLDWRNAFLLQYLTLPSFGFRWFHLQWTIPLLTVLASVLSGYFLWLARSNRSASWQCAGEMLAVALLALSLGSEISYPLWENLETLRRLQFPLRFLQIACIASVFSLVWAATIVLPSNKKLVAVTLGAFLVGSLAMLALLERQYLAESKSASTVAAVSKEQNGQPEMKPATAGGNWKKYLDQGGWAADCANLNLQCINGLSNTHHKVWVVEAQTDVESIRLPIFWFPGWTFLVDGLTVSPSVDPETGLPIIALKLGKTTIEALWVGIPQERIGLGVSLVTLLIIISMLFFIKNRYPKENAFDVA
jgi:uncharacterized membrane protein